VELVSFLKEEEKHTQSFGNEGEKKETKVGGGRFNHKYLTKEEKHSKETRKSLRKANAKNDISFWPTPEKVCRPMTDSAPSVRKRGEEEWNEHVERR